MRADHPSQARWRAARLLALIAVLGLFGGDCKSPTSPKGQGEADITITNNYGVPLDIYVDGAFKFTLTWKTSIEMDDVPIFHEYILEAKEPASGKLIDSTTIDVQTKTDYSWTIEGPPHIKITNNWSERLSDRLAISLDGVFQFNLSRGESRMIMNVEFGERFLSAVDVATGKQVASTTLKVLDNGLYEWEIKRTTGT